MKETTNGNRPELPEGWEWEYIGEIAECRLGKMLDQQRNVGELRPYLRNINVQWGRFDLSDIKEMRITNEEVKQLQLREGDLLVCEGGEPGRCAVWREDRPMFFQKALHRLRPNEGVSPVYLQHYLRFAAASGHLEQFFTGTTIKHLPGVKLARIPVPVPPRGEQDQIVQLIERRMADVNSGLGHLARGSNRLKALRRSLLRAAFRPPYLGVGEDGWDQKRVKDVILIGYGKALPKRDRRPGTVPVFSAAGQTGWHDKALTEAPALVLTRKGVGIGSVYTVDQPSWVIDTAFFAVVPQHLSARFLQYQLLAADLGRLDRSTAIPSLSRDDIYEVELLIPARSRQDALVAQLDAQLAAAEQLEARLTDSIQMADRLLKAIWHATFSGEDRLSSEPPGVAG